jgi:hypothetical protein
MVLPDATELVMNVEIILSAPMAMAELGLAVWLIWKGGSQKQQNKKR